MIWSLYNKKNNGRLEKDNRITLLVAIIFLFAIAIIARLFNVQLLNYDLYAAKALRQHGVDKEIMPDRGRIFVRSKEGDDNKSELYPLAANKDFALIYAVPKDVFDPEDAVKKLAPVLFTLVYEEPDVEHLVAVVEQRLREEMANEIKASGKLKVGEEIVINEEQLAVALEKERLAIEEGIKQDHEKKLEEYSEELFKKLAKHEDPYEPLAKKVDEEKLAEILALKIKGISYSMSSYRYYPEKNISSHTLGYVIANSNNELSQGSYGVEGYFDNELKGVMGSLIAERDVSGQTIIVADRQFNPAINGDDIILTIDKTIQNVACRKLNESTLRHGADLGAIIIMNPKTGAIIAMCVYPDFDPNDYGKTKDLKYFNNIGIFQAYEPGSIFKPITMAMGIDLGLVEPDSVFHDIGSVTLATEIIHNSDDLVYGDVTINQILENSINTGAVYVAQKVGINNFIKYMEDFGFGEKTGIKLKTESEGNISSLYDKNLGGNLNMATASFGQGITTTPLQIVTAFSAIANQGILVKPYIIDEIIKPDGERIKTQPQELKRVISPRAAALVSGMLVNVVDSGHAKLAEVEGYYVAGKTGTAQIASSIVRGYSNRTNHSFVGFAPVDDPQFVMIVYLQDPKDVRFSASSAAPLFGEIADFVLNYYQVEKER